MAEITYTHMNIVKRYIEYLKDNPRGYWFKAKLFGWGWTPAKWQGWVVIIIYILALLLVVLSREEEIPGNPDSGSNFLVFALPIILLTAILLIICYKKGEKPSWNWGFPKGK